jgi:N-acetylmuramoyl-L-alanine amidase
MKAEKIRAKRLGIGLFILSLGVFGQDYSKIKHRFDSYLNYHDGLDGIVKISPENITFNKNGKADFVLPKSQWEKMSRLVQRLSVDTLEKIYNGTIAIDNLRSINYEKKNSLQGVRIVIDPGHIAGNMKMARVEQKYLHFTKDNHANLKQDSLDISEGVLTWQTASILKKMLEEKGAVVALTRKENSTSFGCPYEEWLKKDKKKTLDSLLKAGKLTKQKHQWFSKMNSSKFFVEFFKDYELQQRARVANAFGADLTVIIHYNVNEKNVPWIKPSDKNFCMAFIPGCIIADNVQTPAGKMNLLRLMLTNNVEESEKVSSLLVNELSKNLSIPIAKASDATYLDEHCLVTESPGVFCRNLALCRLVKSPLLYGECLYQDCEAECYELTKNTETSYGVQTNKRVVLAAQSFFNALVKYYSK